MYAVLNFHKNLQSFANFGEHLYHINRRTISNSVQRERCIKLSIERTYSTLLGIFIAYFIAIIMYSIYPVYVIVFEGDYVMLCPILLPFTSLESTMELVLNITFEIIYSCIAIVMNICLDWICVLFICHHGTASKLIEISLDELNEMHRNQNYSKLQRKTKMINILKEFQDLQKYVGQWTFQFKLNIDNRIFYTNHVYQTGNRPATSVVAVMHVLCRCVHGLFCAQTIVSGLSLLYKLRYRSMISSRGWTR